MNPFKKKEPDYPAPSTHSHFFIIDLPIILAVVAPKFKNKNQLKQKKKRPGQEKTMKGAGGLFFFEASLPTGPPRNIVNIAVNGAGEGLKIDNTVIFVSNYFLLTLAKLAVRS